MVSPSSILVELRLHTGPARPDYVPSPEYKEGEAFLKNQGIPLDRADALGMARTLLEVRFDEQQPEHVRERASKLANRIRWEVPAILKQERRERRAIHPLAEIYADLMDLDDAPAGSVVQVNGTDPLGYDTSVFLRYAKQVSADALAGRHQDAVDEELARLSRLFPGPRHEPDPQAIGIAFAMLGTGFSKADIVSVLGYMPDLKSAAADLDELERQLRDDQ